MEAALVRRGALVRHHRGRTVWDVVSESPSAKGKVLVKRDDYGDRKERWYGLEELVAIEPGTPILFRSGKGWVVPDANGKA